MILGGTGELRSKPSANRVSIADLTRVKASIMLCGIACGLVHLISTSNIVRRKWFLPKSSSYGGKEKFWTDEVYVFR